MFKIIPNSAGRRASRTDLGRFISHDDLRYPDGQGGRELIGFSTSYFVDKNKFIYEFGFYSDNNSTGVYIFAPKYYKRTNGHTGEVTHFVSISAGSFSNNAQARLRTLDDGFYDRVDNKIYMVGQAYTYDDDDTSAAFNMRIDCDTGDIDEIAVVSNSSFGAGGHAAAPESVQVVVPWGKQHFIVFGENNYPYGGGDEAPLGVVFRKDTLQPESFSSSTVYYNNFETYPNTNLSWTGQADLNANSAAVNYENKLIAVGGTVLPSIFSSYNMRSQAFITIHKQASNNTWTKASYYFDDNSNKLDTTRYYPLPDHMYWNKDCTKLFVLFTESGTPVSGFTKYSYAMARFSYTSGNPGSLSLDWVKCFQEGNAANAVNTISIHPLGFDRDNNVHHLMHQPYWLDGGSVYHSQQFNYVIWDSDFSTRHDNLGLQVTEPDPRIYEADGSTSPNNRVIPITWHSTQGRSRDYMNRYYDSDDGDGISDYFLLAGRDYDGSSLNTEFNSTYVLADVRMGKDNPLTINKPVGILSYGSQGSSNISGSNGVDTDTMLYWTDKYVTQRDASYSVTVPEDYSTLYRFNAARVTGARYPLTRTSDFSFSSTSELNGTESGTPYSTGTWSYRRYGSGSGYLVADPRTNTNKGLQGGDTTSPYTSYPNLNEFYSDRNNTYFTGADWTDNDGTNRLKDYPGYFLSFENQNMADGNTTADEILPFNGNLIISENKADLDLEAELTAEGWNGTDSVTVTINSGVYIYSDNTSNAALTISSALNNKLTLTNKGYIIGKGGAGGGYDGGAAISNSATGVTITNASGAYIAGGGGGGSGRGGGGAGGGNGAAGFRSSVGYMYGGTGGAPGQSGTKARTVYSGGNGGGGYGGGAGGGGGGGSTWYDPSYGGGGGGGRILPGTGGVGGTGDPMGPLLGGNGGSGSNAGAAGSNGGGGGGGGWGASGGSSGGSGGAAISGTALTLTNNGTIYGAT